MIQSIKFKNFFSFKDEGRLSLQVNEKAPNTDKYFMNATGKRVTKVLSVFGHNASGKTNALKVVSFLQWFIIGAYTEDPNAKVPIFPFEFIKKKKPTEIWGEFVVGKSLYLYYVKLTPEKIIREKLQKKEFNKKKFSTLFERTWDTDKKNGYSWKDKFGLGAGFKNKLRKNASVLATAIRDNHAESVKISDFWKKVTTNINFTGKVDNITRNIVDAAKFYNKNPHIKEEANKLLQKFDLGLEQIDIKEKEEENHSVSIGLRGIHYGNYKLSFEFESAGTKKLFATLKHLLYALESGGVAVLDEFDTDLHPMMSEILLEMFFSKETNPHNAQLIFSAHSPHLLNLLDKYQISFTEKNKKGESEIWRLDEMKGVRLDDNYYVKYLSGAYGAVPDFNL